VVNVIECRHSDSVRQKMRECKFRRGADGQGALKQKGVKSGCKTKTG